MLCLLSVTVRCPFLSRLLWLSSNGFIINLLLSSLIHNQIIPFTKTPQKSLFLLQTHKLRQKPTLKITRCSLIINLHVTNTARRRPPAKASRNRPALSVSARTQSQVRAATVLRKKLETPRYPVQNEGEQSGRLRFSGLGQGLS